MMNQPDGIMTRLSITNILWLALLGATWQQGWLQYVFEKDISFISHGIAVFTAMVLVLSLWKGFQLSTQMGSTVAAKFDLRLSPTYGTEILRNKLVSYISFIEFFGTIALAVGVLGTVIGLILGFSNVDPTLLSNVANAGPTVAEVLKGLSVAFHTTLVGGVANLWLRTNHYMLEQASIEVYNNALTGK